MRKAWCICSVSLSPVIHHDGGQKAPDQHQAAHEECAFAAAAQLAAAPEQPHIDPARLPCLRRRSDRCPCRNDRRALLARIAPRPTPDRLSLHRAPLRRVRSSPSGKSHVQRSRAFGAITSIFIAPACGPALRPRPSAAACSPNMSSSPPTGRAPPIRPPPTCRSPPPRRRSRSTPSTPRTC